MSSTEKILILGGTREAAELARELAEQGHSVTTSLAGRTRHPEPLAGEVRTGGFSDEVVSGVQGLADYLTQNRFDRLIDATHPFATQISANAQEAARISGIAFESRCRPPWHRREDDDWTEVSTLAEAQQAIPKNARVLLALGSQHIAGFAGRKDVDYFVRMIDEPASPLPLERHQLILARPSNDPLEEQMLLCKHAITHIVCRNSGGKGAYAKIIAARKLGIPVIMITRQ